MICSNASYKNLRRRRDIKLLSSTFFLDWQAKQLPGKDKNHINIPEK